MRNDAKRIQSTWSDRNHEPSVSEDLSDRNHERSMSEDMSDRNHEPSMSEEWSDRSHEPSMSEEWSDRSHEPSVSDMRLATEGGMHQQQITLGEAKIKCKNFLATLLRLASDQPETVARNIRSLIQDLIDGRVEPEVFTTRLQTWTGDVIKTTIRTIAASSRAHQNESNIMRDKNLRLG